MAAPKKPKITAPAPAPDAVSTPAATHLHIAARADGFRRCGRAWPASGVVVPMADFSADDLARLRAEPALVVVDGVA